MYMIVILVLCVSNFMKFSTIYNHCNECINIYNLNFGVNDYLLSPIQNTKHKTQMVLSLAWLAYSTKENLFTC
jgi:hypothetical protein